MLFRQLFDAETSTYTYLVGDPASRQAALIDPVLGQVERDLELLRELDLQLAWALDTHVHADHVTAAGALRERTGCKTVAGERGASCVDVQVRHGDVVQVGAVALRVVETPGHTGDSVSYLADGCAFTGDALMVRACGRTDFQNGDAGQLYDSIHAHLYSLPDDTRVYPGHDYKGRTVTTVGEERRFNARLAGRTREQFVTLMNGLDLPRPRHMDVAVPANLACGKPQALPQG
ncbi:MAG: MBL fold metallo-hydrolase [Deltaproteobacteria bacterium]|nr:MBL fold metallo-hydrolase [Deltaproteobacteria bacterium]